MPALIQIQFLTKQMEKAAKELRFEYAMHLRERILGLKKGLQS